MFMWKVYIQERFLCCSNNICHLKSHFPPYCCMQKTLSIVIARFACLPARSPTLELLTVRACRSLRRRCKMFFRNACVLFAVFSSSGNPFHFVFCATYTHSSNMIMMHFVGEAMKKKTTLFEKNVH